MPLLSTLLHLSAGWCTWSLAHNLGHRWWHHDMKAGRQTFYAHGEREHHRVYDDPTDREYHKAEDPRELFISFPFIVVAPIALVFVAAYGWLAGWAHAPAYAAGLYLFMLLDHRLHILFHRTAALPGFLGRLQEMHRIHHQTHARNFFFVSGYIWDVLLGTAVSPEQHATAGAKGVLSS